MKFLYKIDCALKIIWTVWMNLDKNSSVPLFGSHPMQLLLAILVCRPEVGQFGESTHSLEVYYISIVGRLNHSTKFISPCCWYLLLRIYAQLHSHYNWMASFCICSSSMIADLLLITAQFWSAMLDLLCAWSVYIEFRCFSTRLWLLIHGGTFTRHLTGLWFLLSVCLLVPLSLREPWLSPLHPFYFSLALLQYFRSNFFTMLPMSWHKKQNTLKRQKQWKPVEERNWIKESSIS